MNPVVEVIKGLFKKEPKSQKVVLHYRPEFSFIDEIYARLYELESVQEKVTLEVHFPSVPSLRVGYPSHERNVRLTSIWALSQARVRLEAQSSLVEIKLIFKEGARA